MRLALSECASSPLIRIDHGNDSTSPHSGMHWPSAVSRESPVPRVNLEAGRSRYASSMLQAGKLPR